MSLKEHIVELRNRLIKAIIALLVAAVFGWLAYDWLFPLITEPVKEFARSRGIQASVNFAGVTTSFDLHLQGALFIGAIVASPVWIYQLWAFITPGLTMKERRYTLGFMAAAIPLFLGGLYTGWLVVPNLIHALLGFTPKDSGASNIIQATDYITTLMQLMLFMGIAFLLPVVLVGINMAGVIRGATLFKSWRIVVLLVTIVAAMAAPGSDVFSMVLLGVPLLALYFGAMALCLLLDRRRDKKAAKRAEETEATADQATAVADLEGM